jgi:ribosomal protein S18 acetylase RimI-like enzyme
MPPTSFVRATVDDIPRIRSMAERIWRVYYPRLLSPAQIEYMLRLMYSPESLAGDFRDGVIYERIRSADSDAGYLAYELSELGACLRLNKLYLLPEFHGRGLGQASLSHIAATASFHGLPAVELNVNKRNAQAIRAYERAGFRIVAPVVNDIGNGFVMDDYVMRRERASQ